MMTSVKRGFFLALGLFMLVLFSSCGASNTPQTSTASSNTSATQPAAAATKDTTNDYGKGYTTSSPTATPATSAANSIVVKTTSATVNGKSATILVSEKGLTLYYFTPDTASKTACTDTCASSWPPVVLNSGDKPQAEGSLPGVLEVFTNANGKQVVYNNHPLYTFSGDSAPGQMNGEGIGGKWFVATADLGKNQP